MYENVDKDLTELPDDIKQEFQHCVKQFTDEEIKQLKGAINLIKEDMQKFMIPHLFIEKITRFFTRFSEDLQRLDTERDVDEEGCAFKNFSPPKGKLESVEKLIRKKTETMDYLKNNNLEMKMRFKIYEILSEDYIKDMNDLYLWNAIIECVEETNSIPTDPNNILSGLNSVDVPLVNLNTRIKGRQNRLLCRLFIVNADNDFRLNTKIRDKERRKRSEYETNEIWMTKENLPKSFSKLAELFP